MRHLGRSWRWMLLLCTGCGFGITGSTAPDFSGIPPLEITDLARPRDMASGPTGGGGDGGSPLCDTTRRLCDREFTLAIGTGQTGVEVRGDYRPGGWDSGVAMTQDGGVWRALVGIPWNTQVQYKFRIVQSDSSVQWIADPSNPDGISDGFGGTNSVVNPFTCEQWTCTGF